MLTQSGILVMPGGTTSPSLQDIAIGLGRMPRFAGQTRGWWSVLHHSFVMERLAQDCTQRAVPVQAFSEQSLAEASRMFRLAHLMHDAHEAITGDVPTTWKPGALKDFQIELDERIQERFGLWFSPFRAHIKAHDATALRAEGFLVGPPGFADLEGAPSAAGIEAVEYVRARYPSPHDTIDPQGRAVVAFTTRVRELQHA